MGETFHKKAKLKNKNCSTLSISAWCDLNTTSNILKLHDNCPNVKGYCQKQVTFTPEQFQLEAVGFKNHMAKTFEGTQTE